MPTPTLATYGGIDLSPGFPGQVAESGSNIIRSFLNESATTIDFGVAVCRGTATAAGQTDKCKPQGADADVIIGVSVRNAAPLVASADGNNTINYVRYSAVAVMTFGVIFAVPFENVVEGDAVLAVTAQAGKLSGVSAGVAGTGRIAVPGAIWLDTALAGTIGRVRINNSTT